PGERDRDRGSGRVARLVGADGGRVGDGEWSLGQQRKGVPRKRADDVRAGERDRDGGPRGVARLVDADGGRIADGEWGLGEERVGVPGKGTDDERAAVERRVERGDAAGLA